MYSDLPPKQRFIRILEELVLPELAKDGFKLLKSGPSLKKNEERFEWIVNFNASKWNSGNVVCQYNPYFTVRNIDYRKYLKQHQELVHGYGDTGQIGSTIGIHHWDMLIFQESNNESHLRNEYDFAKYDTCQLVKDLINTIRTVGFAFFKMMSDFDSIKQFHISKELRKDAPKLVDLCYVLDRKEELESIFGWYYTSNKNCPEHLEEQMHKRRNIWQPK